MNSHRTLCCALLMLSLVGCTCIREGTVVSKRSRHGFTQAFTTTSVFRYEVPDVYWVQVEGTNKRGKRVRQNVMLFRSDWSRVKVGDHWGPDGFTEVAKTTSVEKQRSYK